MAPKTNPEHKGMSSHVSTKDNAHPPVKRRLKWWILLVLLVFLPIAFSASVYVARIPIAVSSCGLSAEARNRQLSNSTGLRAAAFPRMSD
jgi:hypothetical protein